MGLWGAIGHGGARGRMVLAKAQRDIYVKKTVERAQVQGQEPREQGKMRRRIVVYLPDGQGTNQDGGEPHDRWWWCAWRWFWPRAALYFEAP